jgi:hypothetical protein
MIKHQIIDAIAERLKELCTLYPDRTKLRMSLAGTSYVELNCSVYRKFAKPAGFFLGKNVGMLTEAPSQDACA